MLAQTKDLNVLDNDELIVIFVEDGAIYNVSQILLVSLGEEHHGFCVAFWSTVQSLPVRIFANTLEDGANSPGQLLLPFNSLLGCRLESLASASAYSNISLPIPGSTNSYCLLGQLKPSKSTVGLAVYGLLLRLIMDGVGGAGSSRGSRACTSSRFAIFVGRLSLGAVCWCWK